VIRSSRWWARELARREQAWAQERRELLDRIMHLAGQTWTPPPSTERAPREPVEPLVYTATPEQDPIY
jgi:hypothetical protein